MGEIDHTPYSLAGKIASTHLRLEGAVEILSALEKTAHIFARSIESHGRAIMEAVNEENITPERLALLHERTQLQGETAQAFVMFAHGIKQTFSGILVEVNQLLPQVNALIKDDPEQRKYLN